MLSLPGLGPGTGDLCDGAGAAWFFPICTKEEHGGREKSPVWLGPVAKNLLVSTSLGAGAKEGSSGSCTPRLGQTQTQQAEKVALGVKTVRQGLEKEMELSSEDTPSNLGPVLFLRKPGCSCLIIEVGEA